MRRAGNIAALCAALVATACIAAAATPRKAAPGPLLRSKTIALPEDRVSLPQSAGNDLVTENCTGCHSVEMITTQPQLDAKTWTAEIAKMRSVYHAPIDAADDDRLVSALVALQAAPAKGQ